MVELKLPGNMRRFLDGYNLNQGGLSGKFEPIEMIHADNYLDAFKIWNEKYTLLKRRLPFDVYDPVENYEPLPADQNAIQELISGIEMDFERIPEYAGIYVSFLINESCSEKDIAVEIKKTWDHLGIYNSKNLKITGDCGNDCGIWMKNGEIVVNGGCDSWVGNGMEKGKIIVKGTAYLGVGAHMEGGEIIVEGDVQNFVGGDMAGGKITIEGNVYGFVGKDMTGGEIHLNGNYESIGEPSGGKIYHNGKIIYENGVKIGLLKRYFR